MGHRYVLLLSIFVASAVAGPLNYDQCARHCTENSKLRYDPGVYTYDYESDTITTMQGTTHDESRLHLKAQIDIEAISKCELAMRIRGATLEYSDPKNPNTRSPVRQILEFRRSLEKNVLHFSFQDGQIESLCPNENEESWILNIKKGILSSFQNSMDNLDATQRVIETDVTGRCSVEYQSLGRNWRNIVTVKKTKDLMSCTEHYRAETALQANPYSDQPTKSLPLVEGQQTCEQKFDLHILTSSECTESHRFRPFSKHSSGAITKATQKLTFNSRHNNRFAANDFSRNHETLLFNHNYQQSEERNPREAEFLLNVLCHTARDEIKPDVPRLFTNLVYKLEKLDLSQLILVSRKANNVCKDKKIFTDALAMVGTTQAIQFMKSLIESKEISGSEVDFWLTNLAFLRQPTKEMIAILTPLLDGRYDQAILGISGLVHSFCRSNPNCGYEAEVKEAVRKLVSNLGESCYGRDPRKVILSLKAIGNIGQGSEAEGVLQRCYQNPQLNTETRLAAIQAYRRFSCDISRDDLLNLYTNYKEDSELRIASYLTVMSCATPLTITTIKETLEKEIVNQVGSFVWTHLLNMKESNNPLKREINDIVSNIYLLNKYNTDIRKFSRALEGSLFSDRLNMGAHVDSNIIYTPESYIPRSGMFNLTLDLFGSTVNLFEIGGRVEHLEQMVEKLFGPKGYFPKGAVSDVLKNWRQRRSISDNKIEEMDVKFDAKRRYNQDPYGSMYLKIFGNELWYSNIDSLSTRGDSFDFNTFLKELAREQDVEFSKSFMFLDTTYVIPTGSGMPLRLAVNGTASVGLKVGGKFDVRSMKQVDIRGKLQPSGAIEITSLMSVDAGVAKTGLKMVATLHSSTWVDGLIEVRNGEVARIQMNMPRDKMEFIDVQSKIFLLHNEQEKEQKGALEGSTRVSSCSSRYTNKVLGFEVCSELSYPESNGREDVPLFPMSGAARGRIFARKTDSSLTSYNFEARLDKETVGDEYIRNLLLTLNTPGSNIDRELTLQFQLNQPERSVSFKLKTPVKKFAATAKYSNSDTQKRFDVSVKVDDIEKFAIQSELRADRYANGGMYSPAVEVIGPNGRILAITGSTHIRHGQSYSGQLNIEDLTKKPININVNLDLKDKKRYEGQMTLFTPYLETNLQGFAQLSGSVSSKISLDYQFENSRRESVEFIAKFRDLSASSLTKYSGTLSLQSTAMPQYTTAATWEMQAAKGHIENTLNLNLGDGQRSRMHTINFQEILTYAGNLAENSAALTLKMQYPQNNINYALDMKHENTERTLLNQINIQYQQGKKLTVNTKGGFDSDKVEGEVKVVYPGRDAKLALSAERKSQREYGASLVAQWQRGRQFKASTSIKNFSERDVLKYETSAEVSLPRKRPIRMSAVVTAGHGEYKFNSNVDHNRDQYTVTANYVTTDSFNHRGSVEVKLPGYEAYTAEANLEAYGKRLMGKTDIKLSQYRHITGTFQTYTDNGSHSGSLEVAWDADRDHESAVSVEAKLSTRHLYEGSVVVRTKGRTVKCEIFSSHEGSVIDGNFRTHHKMEVEWDPNRKFNVGLKVDALHQGPRRHLTGNLYGTNPFDNYGNVILSFNHDATGRDWNSNAELKLPRDTQITIQTQGTGNNDRYESSSYANFGIAASTRNANRVNVFVDFSHSSYDTSAGVKAEWGQSKNVDARIATSIVPETMFKGGFNFTSHYELARQLSGNVQLTKNPEGYKAEADAQWDVGKKVNAIIDASQTLSRNRNVYLLTIQATTPFREYRNIFSKNSYTITGQMFSTETVNTWSDKKIAGKASVSLVSRSNSNNLEAKTYLITPFRGFESFEATLLHFNDPQKFKSSVELQSSRRYSPIVLQAEGKWISISDAEWKFLFASPFKNFNKISADVVHKMGENNLRTVAEIIYDDKKVTGELSGNHVANGMAYNTELFFQGTTPFRGYEELKASFVNSRRDYNFLTILQGTINTDVSNIRNTLNIVDYLNFDEELQISSPYMRDVQLTVKQAYKEGNSKYDARALWGRNKRLNIEVEYTNKYPRNGNSIGITFKASTPFKTLRSVNVDGSYESNGRTYTPRILIEWNDSKKISLETSITNNRFKRMDAQATFNSHYYGYEYGEISARYDIASQRKTADVSIKWDPRNNKQITAKGFVASDANRGVTEVNIVTPFRNYETIIFNSNYELKSDERLATLQYQWGWSKISINARHKDTTNGAEASFSLTSPFDTVKQLSLTENYEYGDNILSQTTALQWNEQSVVLDTELLRDGPSASLKVHLKSPFRHYENLMLEMKGDLYSNKKSLNGFLQWIDNNRYEMSALYNTVSSETKGEIVLQWPHNNKLSLDASLKRKDGTLDSFTLNMDSPYIPFKDLHFLIVLNNPRTDNLALTSSLVWDNTNSVEIRVSNKIRGNRYYETKLALKTTFEEFREGSIEGSIRNEERSLQGKLSIVTPYNALSNLELSGSYKVLPDGFDYQLEMDSPENKLSIRGNYINRNFRPVEFKLNVNAPFTSFKTFNIDATANNDGLLYTDAQFVMGVGRKRHTANLRLQNQNKEIEGELKLDSEYLYWKTASVSYKLNYGNTKNIEGMLQAETPNHVHKLDINIKNDRRDFKATLKIDSPRIFSSGAINGIVSYSNRRNRIELKSSINDMRNSHEFQVSYNNDNNKEISAQLVLKSNVFSFRSLDANAKFINSNGKVIDAVITVSTPDSQHTLEGNIKNYETEKDGQIKIQSPLLESGSLMITGSLRGDNYRLMDGSITAATPTQEIRVSGNMKSSGWNNFEAFVTLNTPFDTLRMIRIDTKFLNDNNQNIEGNLEIQSSNQNMRKVGLSGKLHRSHGIEDLSLTLRLPSHEYSTVGLLAIVHYSPDLSTLSPRLTFSLPGKRFSLYSNYENTDADRSAGLGCEWGDQQKMEIAGSVKRVNGGYNAKGTVITPFRNFESLELNVDYSQDKSNHNVGITYRNDRNDVMNVRGHVNYHNSLTFNGEVNVATPYKDFEDVTIRFKQSYRRKRLATSLDCTWASYKKVGFALRGEDSDRNMSGHLYITSSFEILRSLKVNYAVNKDYYNKGCTSEFEYNGRIFLKTETTSVYDQSTRQFNKNAKIDLPTLPFAISLSFVPLVTGVEITLKTNCPSRSVSLRSVYQASEDLFSHSIELSWDERLRRSLSYEVRISDMQKPTPQLYARLNLPYRSFELRGKHTYVSNGCNGELDFYWDAARDQQKHLMLKFEYEDGSNWQVTSHGLKIIISHPSLTKDIVATGKVSLSPDDAFGKLELQYSRYQQHNMMAEVRARNLVRSKRDTHYAVYVTARHPISNTDLRLTGEVVNTDNEASTNLKLSYLDKQRQQRVEELKAKILKLREQIDLIAKSDNEQLRLTGKMFNHDNELTLSLEQQQNQNSPIHSHFRLSKRHLNMDLNVTTLGQDNLHVRAEFPKEAIHFEITHTNSGYLKSDALFHIELEDSQILKSRLSWRPELWQEIKNGLSNKYDEAIDYVILSRDKVSAELSEEYNSKTHIISQAMSQETGRFIPELDRDMERLRYDITNMNNDIYNAYNRNEFYAKSATEAVGTAYVYIRECKDAAVTKMANGARIVADHLCDIYENSKNAAARYYTSAVRAYVELVRNVCQVSDDVWESLKVCISNCIDTACSHLIRFVKDSGSALWRYAVKYMPFLETFYNGCQQFYQNVIDFCKDVLNEINENSYYRGTVEYYYWILGKVKEFQQLSLSEQYDRASDAVYEYWVDYVEIGRRFHDEYLRGIYMQAYEKTSQVYRFLGMDTILNSAVVVTYQRIKSLVMNTVQECVDNYANMKTGIKYEFEPHNGRIVVEIPLPSPKTSLKEALDLTTYPEFQKIMEFKELYAASEDYCIWDTYYKYKRYFEETFKVPPFDTYAMVVGNQHYITFDKFNFDFASECSYLLTRDFVDGNFTVVVNYAKDGRDVVRKSLTILSNNKKVDIGSDYKVTINDAKVELPQTLGDTFITRENSIVTIKDKRGFTLRCNFVHDLCTIYMSGFYFGKTGGLFGTYDYEPQLDTMTPERILVDNVDTFANSWKVDDSGCTNDRNVAVISNTDYRAKEACKKLFDNKDSIFRPCYKMVDPIPYYEMCLKDLHRYDASMFDEKICPSSAAYMTECNIAGVPVRMPKSCVRCDKHDGSVMNSGDVIKISESEQIQSADVVFIVEKRPCNKDSVKMLGKMAQSIEDNLRQKGYGNTRYAVVGFGGNGDLNAPHLQTTDGQEFGNIRSIDSAYSALVADATTWSPLQQWTTNSVFEAIRYAAGLPFRTGSIKSFVLLKCSECIAEEVKADYSEMLRTLLDGDITLHLLMEHEFEMRDNRPGKRLRVFGLDKNVAYTLKDMKDPELSGDRDLLAQLKIPKDFCVPLALEVNGSLFGSQFLREKKRNMYKKFIDIMSRRIAKTAKPSDCQICECISTPDGIGKSVCQRCVSPIIADIISPGSSPILYSSGSSSYKDYSEQDDDEEIEFRKEEEKRLSKGKRRQRSRN